ncbi:SCAN domain-containing protein 3-like [Octopus sinensis]|uniref:SCAN domain-containing protein 3-like n=1 Tax=Octopus sinensis TaxID=2607531 RepID=A0A6P7TRC9_9MOLL|nr:SCAN domain-containing protein 3-like [Octopus sinensis]
MAFDVENSLCSILKNTHFSLQLDESILSGNDSLLLAYVRFVKDGRIMQELLFARMLETNTKGKSMFDKVNEFLILKNIPITNIVACATDGTPSMIVISSINKIKSNSLNSRLFYQLCVDNDEDFLRLLMHSEVRWLSKDDCLGHFCELEVPEWIIDSFQDIDDVESCYQLELIVLKNDWELKQTLKQKSCQDFWLQADIPDKYHVLWEKAKLFFIAFPTSYLAERSFSVVSQLVTKSRNRLDVAERGDLRLRLKNIKPSVEELVSKFIQRHCSH